MRGQTLLDVGDDRLDGLLVLGLLGRDDLLDLGFGGADGEALLDDEPGDLDAMSRVLDAEQGLGVAGGKLALADVALDLLVEGEETDAVGDRRTRLAQTVGHGLLRELEIVHELGDAHGFFDGVEVGALEVLDEREHGAGIVLRLEDARGDGLLADQLEGAEATLAGDDLVAVLHLADDDRLHESLGADGIGELLHLGVVEVAARLMGIGDDRGQRQFLQQEAGSGGGGGRSGRRRGDRRGRGSRGDRGGLGDAASDEGTETATEGFLGRSGHGGFVKGVSVRPFRAAGRRYRHPL